MFGKTDIKSLQMKYEGVVNELTNANQTINVMAKEIDDYKDTIETSTTKYSVEIENLKLKLKDTEKSVNSKVNAALASVGVTSFAVETINFNPVNTTPEESLKKFMSLSGEDKSAYYRENKELINQSLKSQKINNG